MSSRTWMDITLYSERFIDLQRAFIRLTNAERFMEATEEMSLYGSSSSTPARIIIRANELSHFQATAIYEEIHSTLLLHPRITMIGSVESEDGLWMIGGARGFIIEQSPEMLRAEAIHAMSCRLHKILEPNGEKP